MTIYLFSFSDSFFSQCNAEFSAFLAGWEGWHTKQFQQDKDVNVWASIKLFILQSRLSFTSLLATKK
jgi:hypothetical protein